MLLFENLQSNYDIFSAGPGGAAPANRHARPSHGASELSVLLPQSLLLTHPSPTSELSCGHNTYALLIHGNTLALRRIICVDMRPRI